MTIFNLKPKACHRCVGETLLIFDAAPLPHIIENDGQKQTIVLAYLVLAVLYLPDCGEQLTIGANCPHNYWLDWKGQQDNVLILFDLTPHRSSSQTQLDQSRSPSSILFTIPQINGSWSNSLLRPTFTVQTVSVRLSIVLLTIL